MKILDVTLRFLIHRMVLPKENISSAGTHKR